MRFRVSTASMSPLLQIGDTVIARGVRPSGARPGDLIVSRVGEGWRVHRLIAAHQQGSERVFVTKGDRGPCADEPWLAPEWVGVVEAMSARGRAQVVDALGLQGLPIGMALVSRWQWDIYRWSAFVLRRVLLKTLEVLLYGAGFFCRQIILFRAKPVRGQDG
ncbi:MAG: hypothetical protein WCF84_00590 [Anaerolineae bacterium]